MIFSLYYLFCIFGAFGDKTFERIRNKTFLELISDSLFGTWFGDNTWSTATWTMSIELLATFFIYILSQTAVKYRGRFWLYIACCLLVFIPQATDGTIPKDQKGNPSHLADLETHMPIFFFGIMLADLEFYRDYHTNKPLKRPLDYIRELEWYWKIPFNTLLTILFFSLGSYKDDNRCL